MTTETQTIGRESVVDPAHQLISSRRIEGTPVYNTQDEKLGKIHSVMIEKTTGKVAYALLSAGGVFGLRSHVHPVPWEILNYDVNHDGYVVDLTREELENAPSFHLDETDRPRDKTFDEEFYGYYGRYPWYWV